MRVLTKLKDYVYNLEDVALEEHFGHVCKPGCELGVKVTVGKLIANTLINSRQPDAIRADELARRIYHSNGDFEIEDADYNMVQAAIQQSDGLSVLGKAAALRALEGEESDEREDS